MYMWGQTEKFIAAWIHHISNIRIKAPRHPPFLTLIHPPNLEASTRPNNKNSYKNFTQSYSLSLELLHNTDMWNEGPVHINNLKPLLVQLTQRHPVIHVSTSYELKYAPFDYYMH